jgi:predicted transcriptional regulator
MGRLTRRQREFLRKLIDLHRETSKSVHYSALAKQIGVGNVTAYEMLRLLEERGLVQSEYYRPEKARGPGRTSVTFRPTRQAEEALDSPARWQLNPKDWEAIKARILERLKATKPAGYETFLEELPTRLQNHRTPLAYLADMVAAIMIGLDSLKADVEARGLRGLLSSIGLPGELGLSALAGLGVGLSLVERFNKRLADSFLEHMQRYQTMLSELSAENRRRLAQFTQEVLDIVGS